MVAPVTQTVRTFVIPSPCVSFRQKPESRNELLVWFAGASVCLGAAWFGRGWLSRLWSVIPGQGSHIDSLVRRVAAAAITNPNAYADRCVVIAPRMLEEGRRMAALLNRLIHHPELQTRALQGLPKTARHSQRVYSIFSCADYHVTPEGLKLVEANTHASGGIAGALWQEVLAGRGLVQKPAFPDARAVLDRCWEALETDWMFFAGNTGRKLRTVAIVDDLPEKQHFYVEFEIARDALRQRGYRVEILDAAEVRSLDGIDLVYNRCCDFYFAEPRHAVLREALLRDRACFTPSPFVHALLGRKDTLVHLSEIADGGWPSLGLVPDELAFLRRVVPETRFMKDIPRDELWRARKGWVFKPRDRYQAKGVYRGRSISRTTFDSLDPQGYVVQRYVPPMEVDGLKGELRFYMYGGEVQFGQVRLYEGQVTNFASPRGGNAPLVLEP